MRMYEIWRSGFGFIYLTRHTDGERWNTIHSIEPVILEVLPGFEVCGPQPGVLNLAATIVTDYLRLDPAKVLLMADKLQVATRNKCPELYVIQAFKYEYLFRLVISPGCGFVVSEEMMKLLADKIDKTPEQELYVFGRFDGG